MPSSKLLLWPESFVMPIVSVAVHSGSTKRARAKKLPERFEHLKLEKKKLEQDLTTKFPVGDDIKFDKTLDLLMMNGFVSLCIDILFSKELI